MGTMSHLGLENDLVPPEHLQAMSVLWHYGWRWSGPEPSCPCSRATCGLIITVKPSCSMHKPYFGSAKQLHKASECPGERT